MKKLLALVSLTLLDDPIYLLRVWASLGVGVFLVCLGYWIASPEVLPMWPGLLVLLVAALIGVIWEIYAEN